MSLGERIREFRIQRGMTQEELAKILSISPQAISKWERAESMPDTAVMPSIADALGVSLDRLFEREKFCFDDLAYGISKYMAPASERDKYLNTRKIASFCEFMIFNRPELAEFRYDEYRSSSCCDSDTGFTFTSNRPELPFFTVFPEPEDGWENVLRPEENYREFFEAMADEDVLKTVFALLGKPFGFSFDETYAASEFGLSDPSVTLEKIKRVRIIRCETIEVDGKEVRIWFSGARCGMVALLSVLNEYLYHNIHFDFDSHSRSSPYFK